MTPGYIAPELIPSDDSDLCQPPPPNKATDIYAFAVMAYEVVFEQEAWPDVSMALMARVKYGLAQMKTVILCLTLKPARKYKQISTKNA